MKRNFPLLALVGLLWGGGFSLPSQAQEKRSCPPGMALIPEGEFRQGSSDGRLDERPIRKVVLKAFCLDRTEVSMKAYRDCTQAGTCKRPPRVDEKYGGQRPAVYVTWQDAVDFCRFHNKRLPTEAEWERAARGEEGTLDIPLRGPLTCKSVNYGALPTYPCEKGHPKAPLPITSHPPGPYQIHHLAGNVAEWVEDCYNPIAYQKGDAKDPVERECGPSQARVIRGGAYSSHPSDLRASARIAAWAKGSFFDVGFRCAADPFSR